jgi:hypothetical protein
MRQGAGNTELLLIVGADRDGQVTARDGKIQLAGSSDLHLMIPRTTPRHRLHVTPQMLRHRRRPELIQYGCLLNLITEPEHNEKVLETLRKLLRETRGKIINRPEAVVGSTRDQVAKRLAGISGLVVPKAIRLPGSKPHLLGPAIEQKGLQFPIILRRAGMHTGRTMMLVEDSTGLPDTMEGEGDLIATEFVDFRSTDGLYRKYRAFFIGSQIIFRHMLVSDNWNVHAADRRRFMAERQHLLDEEEQLFGKTEGSFPETVCRALQSVRDRMDLDYFGMDFAILPNGDVVLFEANATMNFFPFLSDPKFAYVEACLAPAQRAFLELLGLGQAVTGTPRPDFEPSL